MKKTRIFPLLAILIYTRAAVGQDKNNAAAASAPQAQQSQPAPTIASTVDRQISTIEKEIVEAAEAMPEDKFNFSPESLNTRCGISQKLVRTRDNIKGRPFWGRVWVFAATPTDRNALNG